MLRWYWLPSQTYSNISVEIGRSSDSFPDDITSIYSSLINGARVESPPDLLPLSVLLWFSDSKLPSSKFVNVIISPVCYFEYVAYGMYDTAGHVSIASEYGCDVYSN